MQPGLYVLQGNCFEPDRALPYAPWLDLLYRFCMSRPSDQLVCDLGPTVPHLVKLSPELSHWLPGEKYELSLQTTPPADASLLRLASRLRLRVRARPHRQQRGRKHRPASHTPLAYARSLSASGSSGLRSYVAIPLTRPIRLAPSICFVHHAELPCMN
jgi:hypothetical protein